MLSTWFGSLVGGPGLECWAVEIRGITIRRSKRQRSNIKWVCCGFSLGRAKGSICESANEIGMDRICIRSSQMRQNARLRGDFPQNFMSGAGSKGSKECELAFMRCS
jgi:hypothetical protein